MSGPEDHKALPQAPRPVDLAPVALVNWGLQVPWEPALALVKGKERVS